MMEKLPKPVCSGLLNYFWWSKGNLRLITKRKGITEQLDICGHRGLVTGVQVTQIGRAHV